MKIQIFGSMVLIVGFLVAQSVALANDCSQNICVGNSVVYPGELSSDGKVTGLYAKADGTQYAQVYFAKQMLNAVVELVTL